MELHFDPLGGAAGDMMAAALLDLRPEAEAPMRAALAAAPLPEGVTVEVRSLTQGGLSGRRFLVRRHPDGGTHHRLDDPHHTHWADLRRRLEAAALPPATRAHALAIFTHLAEAEARVHGTSPEAVAFHEVGAWDSIADIVAVSALLDTLGVTGAATAPLPMGGGRVQSSHGPLPVPAPATVLLLDGFDVIDDGIGGERVTPTGAAILRHLCRSRPAFGPRRLAGTGTGFGSRSLPGLPNLLRVLAFEPVARAPDRDTVSVLECEIDDQSGEDLALGLDRLRAHPGVIDAVQIPGFGKKGRMLTALRVLARPEAEAEVARTIFAETTTLGLRLSRAARALLPRSDHSIETGEATVTVKRAERPGGATAKAASEDLADHSRAGRETLRRRAEAPETGE